MHSPLKRRYEEVWRLRREDKGVWGRKKRVVEGQKGDEAREERNETSRLRLSHLDFSVHKSSPVHVVVDSSND